MKRIVIIGGMGPQASINLHQKIIEAATSRGARNNNDYPEIMHISIPVVDFISDECKRTSATKQIIASLRRRCVWQG